MAGDRGMGSHDGPNARIGEPKTGPGERGHGGAPGRAHLAVASSASDRPGAKMKTPGDYRLDRFFNALVHKWTAGGAFRHRRVFARTSVGRGRQVRNRQRVAVAFASLNLGPASVTGS
ncbi:hypothetical protein SAMN04489712_11124 [Thermomonospora echinospora]|uniref:Uncharacterized protein n=1 Tax=Thermomonospora echinospora TaxID=1992 RepID=A0A1H6CRS4_9ACTN|nr:hypothetical protein SAMN04489712_11124 [Thermomonospora echinospora]